MGGIYNDIGYGNSKCFRPMAQIINTLKMKDFTRSEKADYKRLAKAQVIDP